jgi:squalene-associated FAD-dependent desaturase
VLKIAVVGAGWAGLASAIFLKEAGFNVTIFEAAPVPGGRARGLDDAELGSIDNGQHMLLASYRECLALIERMHPNRNPYELYTRQALTLETARGDFRMSTENSKGGRRSLLMTLLYAKGLSLYDKWRVARMMRQLKTHAWQTNETQTVTELLNHYKQTERIKKNLWVPLCLAALNTEPEQASAQLFLNILRDTLGGDTSECDTIIPKVDLSTLWPTLAAKQFDMRYRDIVRKVVADDLNVTIDGEVFDACICALPPYALSRVLNAKSKGDELVKLQNSLNAFEHNAITTLTLKLAQPWQLPNSMMMLEENIETGAVGQWVFNRAAYADQLTVVISVSEDYLKVPREKLLTDIARQIKDQTSQHPKSRQAMPEIIKHKLVVEKRATFAALPGLVRPTTQTAWTRLFLAGDYVYADYPAVLEGAVRSGKKAAEQLINAKLAPTTSLAQ